MKNQWRIILGLILTLVIVIFAILNNQLVEINFGFSKIQAPLIIYIIGSAFIGAMVIALVATSGYMKQRKTISELRKQVVEDEKIFEQKLSEKKEQLEREYKNKEAALQQQVPLLQKNEDRAKTTQESNSIID